MALTTSLAESNDFGDFVSTVTNTALREGRQIDLAPYSPIFYWVGWFVVAYFILYIFTYYVAPAIFGYAPPGYYYRPPWGKSYRRRRNAVEADEGWNLSRLGEGVLSQIDSFIKKYDEE